MYWSSETISIANAKSASVAAGRRRSRRGDKDDLAVLPALGDTSERRVRVLEREGRIDLDDEFTGVGAPAQVEQLCAVGLDCEVGDAAGLLGDGHDSRG